MTADTLPTLLGQCARAGIYRMPPAARAALRHAAAALGFSCQEASLAQSAGLAQTLVALGPALALPEWYGGNLDALYDCLTDAGAPQAPGRVLLFSDAGSLAADGDAFAALNAVLAAAIDEARERGQPFWVIYALSAGGEQLPLLPA